ncbi:unnamed protein product [Phytomonas sp. EM1]|nr:unnamed protein product [Phytomonas sp. EM1]|eukprot:CCW65193.1 unnamed protein product [Phytomonas sp. isolate EM1]
MRRCLKACDMGGGCILACRGNPLLDDMLVEEVGLKNDGLLHLVIPLGWRLPQRIKVLVAPSVSLPMARPQRNCAVAQCTFGAQECLRPAG